MVLVLLSGSALGVTWADAHVPAILQAWYPGQAAGTAVADAIFGKVSPGGRLPVTFYRSVDQLPRFGDYTMAGRTYRFFAGAPLYPFGHGLSYGAFEYHDLQIPASAETGSPVELSVDVTNAGRMRADEVVQVYLSGRDRPAPVPIRALAVFTRVTLDPGERRTIRFTLAARNFSFIDADGQRAIGSGRFDVSVGGKQPHLTGTADARTTGVLTGETRLTGAKKTIEP